MLAAIIRIAFDTAIPPSGGSSFPGCHVLARFLVVGHFDSLLNVPRVAFLFY